MTTFVEKLEATKTHAHRGIRWTPCQGIDCWCEGTVEITQGKTGRDCQSYLVAQIPHGKDFGPGRAASLAKTDGSEVYGVFVSEAGRHADRCDCRGFERFGHCKHTDSLRALTFENNWLIDPRANPDADTGSTETEDQELPECFRGVGPSAEGCPF